MWDCSQGELLCFYYFFSVYIQFHNLSISAGGSPYIGGQNINIFFLILYCLTVDCFNVEEVLLLLAAFHFIIFVFCRVNVIQIYWQY